MRLPFNGVFPVTQNFNDPRYRSSYIRFGLLGHNGVDYGTPSGTPIVAPHSGKVIEAQNDVNGYGLYVKIENTREGSVLAHFSKHSVKFDDWVEEGQTVGYSGNTGNSTGAHLHWGYYRIPRNRENGFNGFIDQTDWLREKAPVLPTDTKKQAIIDIYRGLTGENASEDEIKFRLESQKNLVEIIEDICSGDGRFYTKWVTPNIEDLLATNAELRQKLTLNQANSTTFITDLVDWVKARFGK